jgi:hypothetical protein
MKTIFLIETNPISKKYFTDIHCGYINESKKIKEAREFKSYDEAQKELNYIVLGGFDSCKTLYLSIVKFTVKNE